MSDAPERIEIEQHKNLKIWVRLRKGVAITTAMPPVYFRTDYIRADIADKKIAELELENAALHRAVSRAMESTSLNEAVAALIVGLPKEQT